MLSNIRDDKKYPLASMRIPSWESDTEKKGLHQAAIRTIIMRANWISIS